MKRARLSLPAGHARRTALAAHPGDGCTHGALEGFGTDPAGAGGCRDEDRRAFRAGGRRRDMSNVMDAVRTGMTGKIIDVTDEEDGEHVEIYVE